MNDKLARIRVIIVTDGDWTARQAVETAAHALKLHPLKAVAGNPMPLTGPQVLQKILQAPCEPVVLMVDDKGHKGVGAGERVIEYLLYQSEQVEVLGVIAVASHSRARGTRVDYSVTGDLQVVKGHPVTKEGTLEPPRHRRLEGDTVQILDRYPDLLVVGCGDPGKMDGQDSIINGAEVTRKCLELILEGSEFLAQ